MTAMLPRAWRRPVALLACAAAIAPAAAPAQAADRGPRPSTGELWQDYPLASTPSAAPGHPPTFTSPENVAATSAADSDSGGGFSPLWLLALPALALAIVAVRLLARGRRARKARKASPPAPTAKGRERTAVPIPPDPDQPWTAEIAWRVRGGRATFVVVAASADAATTTKLGESTAIEWPPSGPSEVEAMTSAAHLLDDWMLAAGWRPLRSGDAWYAKRFAWQPPAREEDSGEMRSGAIWAR
jgi:hypothetical protein